MPKKTRNQAVAAAAGGESEGVGRTAVLGDIERESDRDGEGQVEKDGEDWGVGGVGGSPGEGDRQVFEMMEGSGVGGGLPEAPKTGSGGESGGEEEGREWDDDGDQVGGWGEEGDWGGEGTGAPLPAPNGRGRVWEGHRGGGWEEEEAEPGPGGGDAVFGVAGAHQGVGGRGLYASHTGGGERPPSGDKARRGKEWECEIWKKRASQLQACVPTFAVVVGVDIDVGVDIVVFVVIVAVVGVTVVGIAVVVIVIGVVVAVAVAAVVVVVVVVAYGHGDGGPFFNTHTSNLPTTISVRSTGSC